MTHETRPTRKKQKKKEKKLFDRKTALIGVNEILYCFGIENSVKGLFFKFLEFTRRGRKKKQSRQRVREEYM